MGLQSKSMPALPVIADCYRVTFNFSAAPNPSTHNVLHFAFPSGTVGDLASQIDAKLTSFYTDMFLAVHQDWGVSDIDIIPLDGSTVAAPSSSARGCEAARAAAVRTSGRWARA